MKGWMAYLVAALVGATLTVGVYEVRALMSDTSDAFTMARSQAMGQGGELRERAEVKKEPRREVKKEKREPRRKDPKEGAGEGGKEEGDKAARRQAAAAERVAPIDPSDVMMQRLLDRTGGDRKRAMKIARRLTDMDDSERQDFRDKRKLRQEVKRQIELGHITLDDVDDRVVHDGDRDIDDMTVEEIMEELGDTGLFLMEELEP